MRYLTFQSLVVLAILGSSTSAVAQAPAANVARGQQLFVSTGCYQCHGVQGQGSAAGPRLAPTPLPLDAFSRQLRQPRDKMPIYTEVVMPERDLADVYAYMTHIPKAKSVAELPLLSR
ncbi:MAG: cytochrome c, mono- and diheme variant family [Caulobacteraceae bacterium]|jgi:ubiquinol-cytochrome c reductase cytochrome c subunit|nr:cytochrome c, mono- and diheme variant family [Caulobacteraceae bacterium]